MPCGKKRSKQHSSGWSEIQSNPTGNITQFSYDAISRATKIEERTAGSVTSAKQHLWCRSERVEERDATGSLSTGKLFLALGQRNFVSGVGSNYFYTLDASPGSIREMIDATGGVITQCSYDPYGVKTKIKAPETRFFNTTLDIT